MRLSKKALLGLIGGGAVVVTIVLTQVNRNEMVEPTKQETSISTSESTTSQSNDKKEVDKTLYQPIIDRYKTALEKDQADQTINLLTTHYYSTYETDTGYAYYDFDGNGIEELVVAFLLSKLFKSPMITDLYTITEDNEVKRLTNEELNLNMIGERMTLIALQDGTFSYYGSSGADQGVSYGYRFSTAGDSLERTDTVSDSDTFDINALAWTNISPDHKEEKAETSQSAGSQGTMTVTVDVLNVRDTPSKSGQVVATLKRGDKVTFDQKETRDGYIWVSYMATDSKLRRYVAAGTEAGETYATMEGSTVSTASSTVSLPPGLVGTWRGTTPNGTAKVTYEADGTITIEENGEVRKGMLSSYEEVEPGLYRVTSDLAQYDMPTFNLGGSGMRWENGLRLSGNQLTYAFWSGPLNTSFNPATDKLTELSSEGKFTFIKE
ncbi:SH3 domain-containing protein [Streptococcus rifensis]